MNYLDRLKAKQPPNPFAGFAGAHVGHPAEQERPFAGFAGDEGKGDPENQPSPARTPAPPFLERLQGRSKSEVFRQKKPTAGSDASLGTYPPQEPAKPAKASDDPFRHQSDRSRCHVCGEREQPGRWFISVLTTRPDEHHWLHAGECHDEHRRQCTEARMRC